MANRKTAQPATIRKKSVSKASAAKGREDSRAAQIKNEKSARSIAAHKDPKKLEEREHDVDRERKVHRRQKPKKKER